MYVKYYIYLVRLLIQTNATLPRLIFHLPLQSNLIVWVFHNSSMYLSWSADTYMYTVSFQWRILLVVSFLLVWRFLLVWGNPQWVVKLLIAWVRCNNFFLYNGSVLLSYYNVNSIQLSKLTFSLDKMLGFSKYISILSKALDIVAYQKL